MNKKYFKIASSLILILSISLFLTANSFSKIELDEPEKSKKATQSKEEKMPAEKVKKTDEEWKKILTTEQYRITRKKGTERAFTGKYNDFKEKGIFHCVCCQAPLFSSETKYNSGSGWPSFWEPFSKQNIRAEKDNSLFMERVEVLCGSCDAHLGHVFDDGPAPTNKRYCINSAALIFVKGDSASPENK